MTGLGAIFRSAAIIVLSVSACDKAAAFRFEDFRTAEQADAALEKLHPEGSDFAALLETLEDAGATCIDTFERYGDEYKNLYSCLYRHSYRVLLRKSWSVGIRFDDKRNIVNISVKFYMP